MAVYQVMRYESVNVKESAGLDPAALSPANPREKWLRKRTQVKLRVCACWSHTVAGTWPQAGGAVLGAGASTWQVRPMVCPSELSAHTFWVSCRDEAYGAAVGLGLGLGCM